MPKAWQATPAAATAQKGEALITHAVKGLVELLEDVDAFDVTQLR